eukprot:gnl/TRDRNA2_/TRDRNA2_124194_c1_seq1.p2 gnl/TRDRNA2_/TRDRNA2_124194_c1~~gnl/TRDRNA2_/TRDRNA2_124194_c1_seq1.p2  ORF type:complete len:107 (+),score=4.96 gnl/TRDRNA2_/TRDRNA2_124194_c1_seq1:471-791(+)
MALRRLTPRLVCFVKPLKLGIEALKVVPCDCVFCLEEPADIVFSGCGHLAYCHSCRLKVLEKAMGVDWHKPTYQLKRLRLRVSCPLCRKVSQTIEQSRFSGFVYAS